MIVAALFPIFALVFGVAVIGAVLYGVGYLIYLGGRYLWELGAHDREVRSIRERHEHAVGELNDAFNKAVEGMENVARNWRQT